MGMGAFYVVMMLWPAQLFCNLVHQISAALLFIPSFYIACLLFHFELEQLVNLILI